MKKILNAARDYWEAIGIFIGVVLGVYDIVAKATNWGLIEPKWILPVGVMMFFVFGIIAIIKAARKARGLQEKIEELEKRYLGKSEEVVRTKAESTNQTGGQIIAAEIANFYGDSDKRSEMTALKNYDEISGLMNKAIEDVKWFSSLLVLPGEPSSEEKRKLAFQSAKAFHEYFASHRHYFSETARRLLEELDTLLWTSLRTMATIMNSGNGVLWDSTYEKLDRESKTLRENIINEFQNNHIK